MKNGKQNELSFFLFFFFFLLFSFYNAVLFNPSLSFSSSSSSSSFILCQTIPGDDSSMSNISRLESFYNFSLTNENEFVDSTGPYLTTSLTDNVFGWLTLIEGPYSYLGRIRYYPYYSSPSISLSTIGPINPTRAKIVNVSRTTPTPREAYDLHVQLSVPDSDDTMFGSSCVGLSPSSSNNLRGSALMIESDCGCDGFEHLMMSEAAVIIFQSSMFGALSDCSTSSSAAVSIPILVIGLLEFNYIRRALLLYPDTNFTLSIPMSGPINDDQRDALNEIVASTNVSIPLNSKYKTNYGALRPLTDLADRNLDPCTDRVQAIWCEYGMSAKILTLFFFFYY